MIKKTKLTNTRNDAEVVLVGGNIAMYTNSSDCYFYVVGSSDSNELILGTVLDTLLDSVGTLLKESIDKHSLLNNLELILLVMDEIIDNGIIFELDPYKVANRVLMIVRSLSLIFFVSCVCVCVCDFFCFTLNHHPTITSYIYVCRHRIMKKIVKVITRVFERYIVLFRSIRMTTSS